jgi:hypothetical protein
MDLRDQVHGMLDSSWVEDFGYTAPNNHVYPWMWLWDSCFHALIWAALDRGDRADRELASLFDVQNADGCVPHMGYQKAATEALPLWRQPGRSFLTQPPMYAHVIAALHGQGRDVEAVLEPAGRGLRFLLEQRRDPTGLIAVVHPWEGCVAPAGFNALVAFNLRELHSVTGEDWARRAADEIAEALDQQWDERLLTWTDHSDPQHPCSSVRTLESLLPALVTADEARAAAALDQLVDPKAFGAPYGPTGVHRAEPSFRPGEYWRGCSWPQLTYLFVITAHRRGHNRLAGHLHEQATATAVRSGLAEYANPLTGEGLGAIPQGWAGLPCVLDRLLSHP